jgi:P-type conjugative transfer protein TrbJ
LTNAFRPMPRASLIVALMASLLASSALPGAAQLTVFDPVNQQQNLISAARALQQINNQVRQLQSEAQMLARMEQNLVRLKGSLSGDLQRTLSAINTHLQQGHAIALSLKATEAAYARLFPPSAQTHSGAARLSTARQRWSQEYASLERAARLQGEIGDGIAADGILLRDAMDRSRTANGALEVAQAGNELTALSLKQALGLQALIATQQRAETLKAARDLASEAEGRQRFKAFLGEGAREAVKR